MRNTPEILAEKPELSKLSVKLSFFKKILCFLVVIGLFWLSVVSNGYFDIEMIEFESPEVKKFCLSIYWKVNTFFIILIVLALTLFLLKKFNFI